MDLVLCEVALDGLSLCRSLRAQQQELAILLMGSDRSAVAKARAIEAGADDYLGKPILLQDLVQRARLLLERRQRQRAAAADAPAALTGSVADLGLLDVFQSLEKWKKSGTVFCQDGVNTARVWVREGKVVDAELEPLEGEPAFFRLMTWESGQFRVEFGAVDREARIEGGTEALLMEAMRRVDELTRAAEKLPPEAILAVDFAALAARLAELPDEVNGVLRAFDSKRSLQEALELSPLDDLSTLAIVQRLLGDGILRRTEGMPAAKKPSLEQWLGGAARPPPPPPDLVHFPPLRGARRERLRREVEEARGHIARGEAVRLSHVVELPVWHGGSGALTATARRMSPAVGEAALKFAPDAPVSRIAEETEPSIAAAVTPLPEEKAWWLLRWPWYAGGALAAVSVVALIVWPRPAVEKKDAPWLQPRTATKATEVAATSAAPAPPPNAEYAKALAEGGDLMKRGKPRDALREFKRAAQLAPESVPALVALGDGYLQTDDPRSAVKPLEQATKLNPRSGRAHLLLATAYQTLGRKADAARAYQRYLEVEPGGDFARDVRTILANLRR
jgi:tetratricopeptide (TPR) repeat protein